MPYHQNGCHVHHKKALGGLGEKSNTWRENGTWIYANHTDPYILTINCGFPNHWVCCTGDIGCSGFFGAPPQGERKTDHQHGWRLAMCTRMVLFHQFGSSQACHLLKTHIHAYHIVPVTIRIKSNLVTIPHLLMDEFGCLVGQAELIIAQLNCSSPRRPLFLHALSFECTIKLCVNSLNQFSVYFYI